MKYAILFITAGLLYGCERPTQHDAAPAKKEDSLCSVIYLDKYYTDFLSEIKTDYSNRNKIYSQKIKEAIFEEHFSKAEYSELVLETFSENIDDTTGLAGSIADLDANREQIEHIILSSSARCGKFLKNDNVTFYILPATSNNKEILNQMGGVSGITAGCKQILLTIDLNVAAWKKVLEYTVAHEFNHAYWTKINAKTAEWTLLQYLIFEGKADSFAHLLYPDSKAPWTSALSEKERKELWKKIKPELQNENPALMQAVIFGSKNYPHWGGYSLGYDMVQEAFKHHPGLLKTDWTTLDAEKILELSGYN